MQNYYITKDEVTNIYNQFKNKAPKVTEDEIFRFIRQIFIELGKDKNGNDTSNYAYYSKVVDIEKIITNPMQSELKPFVLFPMPPSTTEYHHPKLAFVKLTKVLFKLAHEYFLEKDIDLVHEIQSQNLKDWECGDRFIDIAYNPIYNENYFYMLDKNDYSIKEEKQKTVFLETMEKILLLSNTKVTQTHQLIGTKVALKNDYDKDIALDWLKKFLQQNIVINQKNKKILEEIKTLFTEKYLKDNLSNDQYEHLNTKENEYVLEKQVSATNFVVQFKKINKEKKIELHILEHNFKRCMDIMPDLITDGLVSCNYQIRYNVGTVDLIYEKDNANEANSVEKLFKIYLQEVITYSDRMDGKTMLENFKKIKSKVQLYNKLSHTDTIDKSESNQTDSFAPTKRNKI